MENFKIGATLGANGGLAVVDFLVKSEPILHFLLSVGQLAVAMVTVVYIAAKARKYLADRKKEKARLCRKCPYRLKSKDSGIE